MPFEYTRDIQTNTLIVSQGGKLLARLAPNLPAAEVWAAGYEDGASGNADRSGGYSYRPHYWNGYAEGLRSRRPNRKPYKGPLQFRYSRGQDRANPLGGLGSVWNVQRGEWLTVSLDGREVARFSGKHEHYVESWLAGYADAIQGEPDHPERAKAAGVYYDGYFDGLRAG